MFDSHSLEYEVHTVSIRVLITTDQDVVFIPIRSPSSHIEAKAGLHSELSRYKDIFVRPGGVNKNTDGFSTVGFYRLAQLASKAMIAIRWCQLIRGSFVGDDSLQIPAFLIFFEGSTPLVAGPPAVDLFVRTRADSFDVVSKGVHKSGAVPCALVTDALSAFVVPNTSLESESSAGQCTDGTNICGTKAILIIEIEPREGCDLTMVPSLRDA